MNNQAALLSSSFFSAAHTHFGRSALSRRRSSLKLLRTRASGRARENLKCARERERNAKIVCAAAAAAADGDDDDGSA
jgi:hypothetical protein